MKEMLRSPLSLHRSYFSSQNRIQILTINFTFKEMKYFLSVQFSCSVVSDSLQSHGLQPPHQASLSITNSRSLLKLRSIQSVMPSNDLILCRPLLLLHSIFPSIRIFSNESVLRIRWSKVLEFQLQHQSFQWILRNDFLWDELVWSPWSPRNSQESSPTPQFKSINSSALSFLYSPALTSNMTTGKTIALTRWTK